MFVGGSSRWYHALVVVGASLAGCAAKVERSSVPNDANSGSAGSAGSAGSVTDAATGAATGYSVTNPKQCAFDGAFSCADYESLTDCHCEANAPRAPLDCSSPFAYSCRALDVIESLPGFRLTTTHVVGCHCELNYLTPSDCELPAQFICESVAYGYSGCRCDPNLPQSAADCGSAEWLTCQSDSPRFGCHCECCTIK